MFDVITIGGATRDIFFNTKEGYVLNSSESESGKVLGFDFGSKIIPEKVTFSYGGGALNTAVSFARLGFNVSALINIGKEGTGSLIHKKLGKEGVDSSLVKVDEKAHTALSVIVTKDNDHTMFLYRDANNNLEVADWEALKNTKWLYVASLTGASAKLLNTLDSFVKVNNIKLAWNPGSDQIKLKAKSFHTLLGATEVLILNKAEAREFLEEESMDESYLLEELKKFGPKIVVLTDGNKGSFILGEEEIHQKSLATEIVETTGAGDSFGSTFVACLLNELNIRDAARLASVNSASVISKVGAEAGLLKKEELFLNI